jgi:hypothetical protein
LKDCYPLNYGDSVEEEYALEGVFSGQHSFSTFGAVKIKADAFGMLLLPNGDTLRNVLRVKTLQTSSADTSLCENHRYFARGFRYPVFEIIREYHYDIENPQNTGENNFSAAFFFPPPQDELFENPDTANMNLLLMDSIWAANSQPPQNEWEGMYYNISPNPVTDNMLFEIYLPKPVNNLRVILANKLGTPVINQNKGSFSEGLHSISINMSNCSFGNYMLDFWLDEYPVVGTVVLKK